MGEENGQHAGHRHDQHRQQAGELQRLLTADLGMELLVDVVGDVHHHRLRGGADGGHDRGHDQTGEQRNEPNGQLGQQPAGGIFALDVGIHGADAHAQEARPAQGDQRNDAGDGKAFINLLFFLNSADTLEIHLIGHAARHGGEYPQEDGGPAHADKALGEADDLLGKRRLDLCQRATVFRHKNEGDDHHQNHEAGKEEVCPGHGFHAGGHHEKNTDNGHGYNQYLQRDAGDLTIDFRKRRQLVNQPAEGDKNGQDRGQYPDKEVVVAKTAQHIGNGFKFVCADPVADQHKNQKR